MKVQIKSFDRKKYLNVLKTINDLNLKTICLSANCPNRYECFSKKTATVLVLGDICTRNCRYCDVKQGIPNEINFDEINQIIELIKKINLQYIVITQVTRDDLKDGGADFICQLIKAIRNNYPNPKIELLISDLNGNWQALNKIIKQKPNTINHNIEVVESLFNQLRPKGNYKRSLELLKKIEDKNIIKKSGIMVGFGETEEELIKTFKDLKEQNVNILTIGQYIPPNKNKAKVKKIYTDKEFIELKTIALELGFKHVEAGPLVRSSYHAGDYYDN